MGVEIYAIRLGKRIADEYCDTDCENATMVYSLDFAPIEHLPEIKEGFYEVTEYGIEEMHFSYGGYGRFREKICKLAYGRDVEDIWLNVNDYIGLPFIELIDFADNEGNFDYIVAYKLLEDFKSYLPEARKVKEEFFLEKYEKYMEILQEVVDFKGVIVYS